MTASTDSLFLCISCRANTLIAAAECLVCPTCAVRYPIKSDIPIILPSSQQLNAFTAAAQMPLPDLCATYDRAYAHNGLMGTDLDTDYDRATKETLLNFAAPLAGKKLLDVGAGAGKLWDYAPADVHGYAFDPSLTGSRLARQAHPRLTLTVSLGEYIPYANAFFDAVIAADTLEHTASVEKTLREIYRTLKPGGVFAASLPVPHSLRKWGYNQFIRQRPNLRLLYRLVYVVMKRIFLFGRPNFQPIDRDYDSARWTTLMKQAGFSLHAAQLWPLPPRLPLALLVKAVKEVSDHEACPE